MPEPTANESSIHLLLCQGGDPEQVRLRVARFFEKNFLVRYDRVEIPPARIVSGTHPDFQTRLSTGLVENRRAVAAYLAELRESGFQQLSDLAGMRRGYESKILHIVTHLLDGFFGIDSRFYNLEEESHGLSERMTQAIRQEPGRFWLLEARGMSDAGREADQLAAIRGFQVSPP